MLVEDAATRRRVLATNPATREDMARAAHALFARDGKAVSVIRGLEAASSSHGQHRRRHLQQHLQPRGSETAVTLGLATRSAPGHGRPLSTSKLQCCSTCRPCMANALRPSPLVRRRRALGRDAEEP